MVEEKGVYIYANLLDLNEDGKIDMTHSSRTWDCSGHGSGQ